ncbi:MAG: hypothetical protein V7L13_12550 [Nostoc sp.]|uniref:hypothetical protein n=1 Tax=Nostoc sp. TaxID=1180 RepID=UPI002FFB0077
MSKLLECNRCLFYAHNPQLVCAVHPTGPSGNTCLDFRDDPELETKQFVDFLGIGETDDNPYNDNNQQWEPEGARYVNGELTIERTFYNGELIVQPQARWTPEQQLELIDWHPMFTGRCPRCSAEFDRDWSARVHWDCQNPECGWMDDTV